MPLCATSRATEWRTERAEWRPEPTAKLFAFVPHRGGQSTMTKPAILAAAAVLALFGAVARSQNQQIAATQRADWMKFNPVTPLTAASFAQPPAADLPWVRMNMPSTADSAEVAAEVREMHEYGISGVEIGQGVAQIREPGWHQGQPQPWTNAESGRVLDR
jgi:hypothetical protein